MDRRTSSGRLFCLAVAAAALPAVARTLPPIDALATASPAVAPKSAALAAKGVSVDRRLGLPTFLWATQAGRTLAAKSALEPEAAARGYLRDVADLYRISPAEIAALPMHDLQRFPGGGAVVRFRGQVEGVPVFREHVNVMLDKAGALVAIGGFASGEPAGRPGRAAESLGYDATLAIALADFGFGADVARLLGASAQDGGYVGYTLPAGVAGSDGSTLVAARATRVWFRLPAELVPAHFLEVQVRDGAWPHDVDSYAYVVSASDGTVLFRHDQTLDAAYRYRVHAEPASPYLPLPGPGGRAGFPHPTGTPNGFQPPLSSGNVIALESLPFSRNDPWLANTSTRTTGNNVDAFTNALPPDGFGPSASDECTAALPVDGDLHACLTSQGTFDYVYDFALAPLSNRAQASAGVTNLFYMVNYLHDWFYDAGFDEAAGNAQADNFGRGGLPGDSIIAEAQDYNGVNNASMTTPADGGRPRMRMLLWTSSIALTKVEAPAAIAGAKQAGAAEFGAQVYDFTNNLVLALDAADPQGPTTADGCTTFANPAAIAGRIAVVDRGTCTFVVKAKNAQNAGAIGVVIVNNVSPGAPNMAGTDATITIPVVSISIADGDAIKGQLGQSTNVRLRMARQRGVPRDGALDNTLVAHEWGHYISNRLVGNAVGLSSQQAEGMGEGFADFHALLLLAKDADRNVPGNANFSGTYAMTAYSISGPDFAPDALNNAYYYGIRRYPYSRDMAKNPLTFRHISNGVALPASPAPSPRVSTANAEVHSTGEVWASMLWECYTNLVNDTTRLAFAEAQARMKRYLVAGYKMTPVNPTFVSARDALLAAMQAGDARDRALCMQGFAKRGLGVDAVAPDPASDDNAGVVESFRAVDDPSLPRSAIEYHHAAFDHYFVTSIPGEIAKLDDGTLAGWTRTGQSFNVFGPGAGELAPVCRFFSTAFDEKSSHFYTPDAVECEKVRQDASWQFEAVVFAMATPDAAGACAEGAQPVYRMYNGGQGGAPNHRYTTSLATRAAMLANGWIAEGLGAQGVVMCAVQ